MTCLIDTASTNILPRETKNRSGPLTYRTYDGRRKARFLDILSLFNRINNSKLRISELETIRLQQTHERVEYRQARASIL